MNAGADCRYCAMKNKKSTVVRMEILQTMLFVRRQGLEPWTP